MGNLSKFKKKARANLEKARACLSQSVKRSSEEKTQILMDSGDSQPSGHSSVLADQSTQASQRIASQSLIVDSTQTDTSEIATRTDVGGYSNCPLDIVPETVDCEEDGGINEDSSDGEKMQQNTYGSISSSESVGSPASITTDESGASEDDSGVIGPLPVLTAEIPASEAETPSINFASFRRSVPVLVGLRDKVDFKVDQLPTGAFTHLYGPLYFVNDPDCVVCSECKDVVSHPYQHLKRHHSCHQRFIKKGELKLNVEEFEANGLKVKQLPFIEIVSGEKCSGCGRCALFARSIYCSCRNRKIEKVAVQRINTRGASQRQAYEVERWERHLVQRVSQVDKVIDKAMTKLEGSASENYDGLLKFYKEVNFFTRPQELGEYVRHELYRLLDPVFTEKWEKSLRKLLLKELVAMQKLPPVLIKVVKNYPVQEKTNWIYTTTCLYLIRFVVNLSRASTERTSVFPLMFPFKKDVDRLLNSPEPQLNDIFDLVFKLMRERYRSNEITVTDAFIRAFSVNPTTKNLKDTRQLQQVTSGLMKLWNTAVLHHAIRGTSIAALDRADSVDDEDDASALSIADAQDLFEEAADELYDEEAHDAALPPQENRCRCLAACSCNDPDIFNRAKEYAALLDHTAGTPFAVICNVKYAARKHQGHLEPSIVNLGDGRISCDGKAVDLITLSEISKSVFSEIGDLIKLQSFGIDTKLTVLDIEEDYANMDVIDQTPRGDERRKRILKHVVQEHLAFNKFDIVTAVTSDDQVHFNCNFAKAFFDRQNRLENLVLLLMHISGGMTARGTELKTLRLTSAGRAKRNLFVFKQLLFIQPSYSKTDSISETLGQFRFLDETVSNLLLRFYVFIRPFADAVAKNFFESYAGDYFHRFFVYNGKAMTAARIRDTITSLLGKFEVGDPLKPDRVLSFPVCFRRFRHVVKEFFNWGIGASDGEALKGVPDAVRLFDLNKLACLQANHSEKTGSSEYALVKGSHMTFNKVQFTGQLLVSRAWHQMVLHGRRPSSDLRVSPPPSGIASVSTEFFENAARAISGASSSFLNLMLSSATGSVEARPDDVEPARKKPRVSSTVDHLLDCVSSSSSAAVAFLGSLVSLFNNLVGKIDRVACAVESLNQVVREGFNRQESYAISSSRNPFSRLNAVENVFEITERERDAAMSVRDQIFTDAVKTGKLTTWRSAGQREAVTLSLTQRDLLCILPTGGGKWLTFRFCSEASPEDVVVVLVPTNSLQIQHLLSLKDFANIVSSTEISLQSKGIVVLNYAKVQQSVSTLATLESLSKARRLKRIFFDEAHCLVVDEFRDMLLKMPKIICLAPVTYLTATATRRVTDALIRCYMEPKGPYSIVRTQTNRSNLQYCEINVGGLKALDLMLQEVFCLGSDKLAIIFCGSQKRVEVIVDYFRRKKVDCVEYLGVTKMDPEVQDKNAAEWRDGRSRLMVATSAFGVGIDAPNVGLVILADFPYSLEDGLQMAGRAGRDGSQARVLFLYDRDPNLTGERAEFFKNLINENFCIRGTLTSLVDGISTLCCDNDANELCSHCSPPRVQAAPVTSPSSASAQEILVARKPLDGRGARLSAEQDALAAGEIQALWGNLRLLEEAKLGACRVCSASLPSDHVTNECSSANRCTFCYGRCPFISLHETDSCPFKKLAVDSRNYWCPDCWLPSGLSDMCFHGINVGGTCNRFSIKLFWIEKLAAELCGEVNAKDLIFREFKKLMEYDSTRKLLEGVKRFAKETTALVTEVSRGTLKTKLPNSFSYSTEFAANINIFAPLRSLPGPEYGEQQTTSVNPRIDKDMNRCDAQESRSFLSRIQRVVTDDLDNLLTLQEGEVARFQAFISANKKSCGKCLIEGRPHDHNAPECSFVQAAKCEFCLDIPLFLRDCQRWCPFKPYPKQACAGCWLPNYIGDQAFHNSVNFSSLKRGCVFFSIKLFLIRSRYLELAKSTIGTEANAIRSQMEKDYSKWIGHSNGLPTGLCIFVREVLPKLKSLRIDRVQ